MYSVKDLWLFTIGVSPFGYLRVIAYFQLTAAFRRLSRPSSALSAKAFTLRSFSLEQPFFRSPIFNFGNYFPAFIAWASQIIVLGCKLKDLFLKNALIHCCVALFSNAECGIRNAEYALGLAFLLAQSSTKLFLPCFYTEKPLIKLTSFSQYTTICFVSFLIRFSMNSFFEHCVFECGIRNAKCGTNSPYLSSFIPLVEMMGIPTVSLREPVRVASNAEPVGSSSIHRLRYEVLKTPSESFRLHGGDDGIRTHDPLLAGQVLSQLSYTPKFYWEFAFSPSLLFILHFALWILHLRNEVSHW